MMKKPFELIYGDAIKVLKDLDSESFDFIFADPPYFLSKDGFTVQSGKAVSVNKGKWDKSKGFQDEIDFHENWIRECQRLLKKNGSLVVSGTYHSIYKCGSLLQKLNYRIINEITWFKPNGAPALAGRNFTASHESLIWASKNQKSKHTFNYPLSRNWNVDNDKLYIHGKQMRSVWSIPSTPKREKSHGQHPTQKPLELLQRFINLCTNEGDLVLDPFCGSGTTGVACLLNNRQFLGIDSEKKYIKLAQTRMENAIEDYS